MKTYKATKKLTATTVAAGVIMVLLAILFGFITYEFIIGAIVMPDGTLAPKVIRTFGAVGFGVVTVVYITFGIPEMIKEIF